MNVGVANELALSSSLLFCTAILAIDYFESFTGHDP